MASLRLGRAGAPSRMSPATVTELTEGLAARRQNGWPSVEFDLSGDQLLRRAAALGRVLLQDLHGSHARRLDVL